MSASILRKLASLLLALVPLVFLAALFAGQHNCACGMSKDACFCELVVAKPGAHCDMSGPESCSMRSSRNTSGVALVANFDLRGWLQARNRQDARPVLAMAATISIIDVHADRSFLPSPEPPPPRTLRFT